MAAEFARVRRGAHQPNLGSTNDIWLGTLDLIDGSVIPAFLKDLPPKEMANELIGAALARALGLPVPRIFLAIAPSDVVAAKKAPSLGDHRVLIASERQRTPPLGQFWTGDRLPQMYLNALASWPHCGTAFAFDTWVANIDRNIGNILFAGAHEVWLIDHGRIMTGSAWMADELVPNGNYMNRMSDWLIPHLDSTQQDRVHRAICNLPQVIGELDLDDIAWMSGAMGYLTPEDGTAMLSFLQARLSHVPPIASKQAGIEGVLI